MTAASLEDLGRYLKKKCKLKSTELNATLQTLQTYYARRKDFDLFIKNGKVVIVAKKTPTQTPEP